MIYRKGKELTERYHGSRAIAAIYKGTRLLWEAAKSCFGRGVWIEDKTWSDEDKWLN